MVQIMAHKLKIDMAKSIACIQYDGLINLDVRKRMRCEIARLVDEHSLRSILIDTRQGLLDMSLLDLYQFGSSFDEVDLPSGIKIAVVLGPQDQDTRFALSVAFNRGVNVKEFTEPRSAVSWLQSAPRMHADRLLESKTG